MSSKPCAAERGSPVKILGWTEPTSITMRWNFYVTTKKTRYVMCIKLHEWQSGQNQIGFLMASKVIIFFKNLKCLENIARLKINIFSKNVKSKERERNK